MNDLCPVAASVAAMNLEDQPKTIGGSLLWLLKSQKFCNVIFTFPNRPERIEAHKFCLKARSPVFEQIFRMRKSGNVQGNEIEISECTPERFKQFLEFIYSDKFEVDIAGALDLLHLSLKYKVHPLTMKCEELLQTEIPIVDSVKVFEAARQYGRRELMVRAGQIMVKSFLELVRTEALVTAEEETLVHLLECDELAVKEVGLFQFILDWGRNQTGPSADEELLRNKLKNLISRIRYTNMTPEEFTTVVVPTGLQSAEETISIYSYLSGDEVTRTHSKLKFCTTHRKGKITGAMKKSVDFFVPQKFDRTWFPAFFKHSMSFKADRMQSDGKVYPYYLLMKTAITAIKFHWPQTLTPSRHSFHFNVSIGEHPEPGKEGNITKRFQKLLLHCEQNDCCEVSVEPPVELMSGRTYSVIVEDQSSSSVNFRIDAEVYFGPCFPDTHREPNTDLEDFCMTLKDIQTKTDYCVSKLPGRSEELALIRGITIKMV